MDFNQYMNDGAGASARAVLAYLSQNDGIDSLWDDEIHRYKYQPQVARWSNCREQGYVITLGIGTGYWLCVAFFEHRNSSNIVAIRWVQEADFNPPNISTAKFGDVYKDKYDVSHEVAYNQPQEMAAWIWEQLVEYAVENQSKIRH